MKKTFSLDFEDFGLKKNSELTIASVAQNNYFDSVAGFTGNIAYIEMSGYYTENLEILWTGYLPSAAYGYKGILLDFDF